MRALTIDVQFFCLFVSNATAVAEPVLVILCHIKRLHPWQDNFQGERQLPSGGWRSSPRW